MPSLAELEQWMEEQLPPNLHDLPLKVTATIQTYSSHLYAQLSDLTPSLSQIESSIESSLHNIPFVSGAVSSLSPSPPPPSPPPPPCGPIGLIEALLRRGDAVTGSRARTSMVACIGLAGITLAALPQSFWLSASGRRKRLRTPLQCNGVRQEVIVVLGGDTPLGQLLCHTLTAQGFIVLASVTSEKSMQTFDSLIPPSSRGYIKSIVLNSSSPGEDDVSLFVRSVASAKELRWPLTSAGDPYSRPGSEAHLTGVINALSYDRSNEQSSDSLQLDELKSEFHHRVITPLATIKALLPLFSPQASTSPNYVVSLSHLGEDIPCHAILAGMTRLSQASLLHHSGCRSSKILFTTLEACPRTARSMLFAALPSSVGGVAPLVHTRVQRTRTVDTAASSSSKSAPSITPQSSEKVTRPHSGPRQGSMSGMRWQRDTELRLIIEAVSSIVLQPLSPYSLRSRYKVYLPPSVSDATNSSRSRESAMLHRLVRTLRAPFLFLCNTLGQLTSYRWLSAWSRPGRVYYGTRNNANNRPAYGPGPGPASNTHSRSCIRPSNEIPKNARSSQRPRSAHSTSSSEAARSTESHGPSSAPSGPGSSATPSGPPSNNGMSSSGLLSSVPSSTFGDVSEEEHFNYEYGGESPVQGSEPWASPVPSEHDSDTALGSRTLQLEQDAEDTPSASRTMTSGQMQYGFPSQASMQSSTDAPWMGPVPRASPNMTESTTSTRADGSNPSAFTSSTSQPSSSTSTNGTRSPLGQSWVAVHSSSADDVGKGGGLS